MFSCICPVWLWKKGSRRSANLSGLLREFRNTKSGRSDAFMPRLDECPPIQTGTNPARDAETGGILRTVSFRFDYTFLVSLCYTLQCLLSVLSARLFASLHAPHSRLLLVPRLLSDPLLLVRLCRLQEHSVFRLSASVAVQVSIYWYSIFIGS